ncbi:putative secreted protein (Por secretion system target) [Nonlabens dokdonensis]|uniref:Carboxypeptidase T n=2 Tax=Nonlabens dokdonensis TaxID=328515 RepID=L7WA44_NONDD|nr:LamG-like jellyroll fold domain-containing protein [Nonlabens dokdonensis]AGC77004.1 carboxypeptidase T [Nonlabens dokdonensis DSW-6]PZX36905.1 putative secreted protein (Por secretion system target) [Nonlabens dokdonensis]
MKRVLLLFSVLLMSLINAAQNNPTAIAQSVELCHDTNNQYVLSPSVIDNGSSDPDGPITMTVTTALTSSRPSIAYNATHQNKGSLYFDGNGKSSQATVNALPIGTAARTYEIWVRPESVGNRNQFILSYGSAPSGNFFSIGIDAQGRLFYNDGAASTLFGNATLNFNEWTHVAITYDSGSFKVYINGVASSTLTMTNLVNPSNLSLGGLIYRNDFGYKGNLSELRIWDVSRTANQIQTSYNKYLSGAEANLVYYNKLNEGSGNAVYDSRFLTGGSFPIAGTNQPVWSDEYPDITFQNEIGTYHVILNVTDTDANVSTALTTFTLANNQPEVSLSDISLNFDANGNANFTSQDFNPIINTCLGFSTVSLSRNSVSCEDFNRPDGALQFPNGVVLTNPNLPTGNESRTVMGWFRANGNTTQTQYFFDSGRNSANQSFILGRRNNNLFLAGYSNDLDVPYIMTVGEWIHIAGTYDGTTMKLFVNGELIGTRDANLNTVNSNNRFAISRPWTANGAFFQGGVADLKMYSRAIPDYLIRQYSVAAVDFSDAELIMYYPLSENITTQTDLSGNGSSFSTSNFYIPNGPQEFYGPQYVTLSVTGNNGEIGRAEAEVTATDNLPPVITLNGASSIDVIANTVYTELGAVAIDNCSSDSVVSIDATAVDMTTPGSYQVIYTATPDDEGNVPTPVNRTVNVLGDTVAPVISQVTYNTDNSLNDAFAKAGDFINLSFESTEPLPNVQVTIGGQVVNVTENLGVYTAQRLITNADPEGLITFEILNIEDAAGNSVLPITTSTNASTVTVDLTPPVIQLSVASNGVNPSVALLGESLDFTFSANEDILVNDATIYGDPLTFSGSNGTYSASYTTTSSTQPGVVPFISYSSITDLAGNAVNLNTYSSANVQVDVNSSELILGTNPVALDQSGTVTLSDSFNVLSATDVEGPVTVTATPDTYDCNDLNYVPTSNSFYLDGNDYQYIDVDTQRANNADGGISFWIKPDASMTGNNYHVIMGLGTEGPNGNNTYIAFNRGALFVITANQSFQSVRMSFNTIPYDEWTHIVINGNGGARRWGVFVNGVYGNRFSNQVMRWLSRGLHLGKRDANFTRPNILNFKGELAQLRIFNNQIPDENAAAAVMNGESLSNSNEVVSYAFDRDTGEHFPNFVDPTNSDEFVTMNGSNMGSYGTSQPVLLAPTDLIVRRYDVTDQAGQTKTSFTVQQLQDPIAPTLTLIGDNPLDIELNAANWDPGVTVTDNCSEERGELRATGVNVRALGSYQLRYTYTDAAGNTATPVIRDVNVVAATSIPEINSVSISHDGVDGVAIPGDTVTIEFTTSEDINLTNGSLTLGGQDISNFAQLGVGIYNASFVVPTLQEVSSTDLVDGPLSILLTGYEDTDGNSNVDITTTTDGSSVVIAREKPILNLTDATIAVDGTGNATLLVSDVNNGSTDSQGGALAQIEVNQTNFDCSDIDRYDIERSINFNAGAQGINLGPVDDFDGSFTTEMWVRTTSPGQVLLAKWQSGVAGRFLIIIDNNGKVNISTNVAPFTADLRPTSSTTISDGQWHHIAYTYDYDTASSLGTIKLYVDGNLEDTSIPLTYSTTASGLDVNIGRETNAGSFFTGEMDDIRIWNEPRTATQIVGGMFNAVPVNATGLLRYYSSNGEDASNLVDLTTIGASIDTATLTGITLPNSGIPVKVEATDNNGIIGSGKALITIEDNVTPVLTCANDLTVEATTAAGIAVSYDAPMVNDGCATNGQSLKLASRSAPDGMRFIGVYNGDDYFISQVPASAAANYATAVAAGLTLVTINNGSQNDAIAQLLRDNNESSAQIGLSDTAAEGDFEWQDGTPFLDGTTYDNWGSGEPNNSGGNEDYTTINVNATTSSWNDTSGGSVKYLVALESANNFEPTGMTFMGVFENHTYYLSNTAATAVQAYDYATNNNYNLVSVNSEAENQFIVSSLASNGLGDALLGFSDVAAEGTFIWQDGSPVTYTNWNSGEPNNFGSGEDYVHIFGSNGLWNDTSSTASYRYIVEIPSQLIQTSGIASGDVFPVGTTTNTFTYRTSDGDIATCSNDVAVNLNLPPTLTSVSVQSDNANSAFAKAGDRITLSFTSDDDLQTAPVVNIAGQSATMSQGVDAKNWSGALRVPTIATVDQTALPDGVASIEITFTDLLGLSGTPVTTTTDGSTVTILRTLPAVMIQNVSVPLDNNGNATITPQALDNGTTATNGIASLSLDRVTFDCNDLSTIDRNSQIVADLTNSTDYINAGDNVVYDMTTQFSFTTWYKETARNGESILFNREGEYELAIQSDGEIRYAVANTTPGWAWVDTGVIVPLNKWTHIAFTYESGSPKLYINGILEYTGSGTGSIVDVITNQNELWFGWRQNQGNLGQFTGFMDEISLWNRVLTAAEVGNTVTSSLTGNENGLVLYYPINNTSGSTVSDIGVNNINSTIINSVATPKLFDADYRNDGGAQITLTATDQAGNSNSADAFINVQDNIAPDVTLNRDAVVTLPLNATYIEYNATATDNCGINAAGILRGGETVDTSTSGTYVVTYTATDTSGNSSQVTRTVTVDGTLPTLTAVTVQSDNANSAFAKAGDTIILSFIADEELTNSPVVTIAGLTATVSAGVNAQEWTATAVVPDIATVDQSTLSDGIVAFTIDYTDTASNDGITVTATTDASQVTIDRTAPVLNAQDFIVDLDANGAATITLSDLNMTATDMGCIAQQAIGYCGLQVAPSLSVNTFSCQDLGNNSVTITAIDMIGNVATTTVSVTVRDTTAPIVDFNGNQTIDVTLGSTYADVPPTITDNCATMVENVNYFVNGLSAVNTNQLGTYTVSYFALDGNGNFTNVSRTINVIDDTLPILTTVTIASDNANDVTIAGIGDRVTLSFSPDEAITNVTATLGSSSMTVNGPATLGGSWTATYIVQENDSENGFTGFEINFEDLNGNSGVAVTAATAGASQIDVDAIKPVFNSVTMSSNNTSYPGFVRPGRRASVVISPSEVVTATGTIGMQTASLSDSSINMDWFAGLIIPNVASVDQTALPDGQLAFEITITDAKGNTAVATATTDGSSLILDRTPPTVVTQPATYTLDANGRATANLSDYYISASDANGIAYVDQDFSIATCFDVGTAMERVVEVTDGAGNRVDAEALITVIDNIAPVITTDIPSAGITVNVGEFVFPNTRSSDNCGVTSTSSNLDDFDSSVPNTFTYISTATDSSGNETILTRTVEVVQPEYIYENGAWTPNDPSDAANPSGEADHVIVKEDITISADFTAKELFIDPNVTLTVDNDAMVTLAMLDNDGVFEARNATVQFFSNSDIRRVTSNNLLWESNQTNFGDLIANVSSQNLVGVYDLYGDLIEPISAFSSSEINLTNADFTFKATPTTTAMIDGSVEIFGDVTVEQYFDNRRAYRFVSRPVTTSTTIFDNWQEGGLNQGDSGYEAGYGTHITGAGAAANGFDLTGNNNPSLFSWDNTAQTWVTQTSTNLPTDLIETGKPYRLFVRGDREINLNSNASASSTTLRTKGTMPSFAPSRSSIFGPGYEVPNIPANAGEFLMVGNPYQSVVDIAQYMTDASSRPAGFNISGVQPLFYYVWDPMGNTRGVYRTFDALSGSFLNTIPNSRYESGELQPGQAAFFIASGLANGSFFLPKPTNNPFSGGASRSVAMHSSYNQSLKIKMFEASAYQSGSATAIDAVAIYFDTAHSNALDGLDALKFGNIDENLGRQHASGSRLSIERREMPLVTEVLPLHVNNYRNTNYTFEIDPVGLVAMNAYLKDRLDGSLTQLSNNQSTVYSFSVDANDPLSVDANRFEIVFQNITLGIGEGNLVSQAISIYPNPVLGSEFYIDFGTITGFKTVTIYNALGQIVNTYSTEETSVYELKSDALAPGMYVIEIEKDDQKFTEKLIVK